MAQCIVHMHWLLGNRSSVHAPLLLPSEASTQQGARTAQLFKEYMFCETAEALMLVSSCLLSESVV